MNNHIWSRIFYGTRSKVHCFVPDPMSPSAWASLCGLHHRARLDDRTDGKVCERCQRKAA